MVEVYVSYWYLLELPRRDNSKKYPHPKIEKISPCYLCCPILSVSMHLKVPCPGNICLLSQRSILLRNWLSLGACLEAVLSLDLASNLEGMQLLFFSEKNFYLKIGANRLCASISLTKNLFFLVRL